MNTAAIRQAFDGNLLAGRRVGGSASARIRIDDRDYINFYGSRYLALSDIPEIRSAVLQVLEQGAPFSRAVPSAIGGIDPIFDGVERAAAAACGTEASVYFASGYLIGAVGLAYLKQFFDLVVLDEHAHYNLKDAAELTGLPHFTFAHADAQSLEEVLKEHVNAKQRPLVVTDGVFATRGTVPPLTDYAAVLAPYDGRLFVDEAHGFGVLGQNGRGAAEYCGVEHLATMGATLSKAFCAHGAIVACSSDAASRLRAIPPLRGTCAGSPLSAAAAKASFAYVATHPQMRENLSAIANYLRTSLRGIGLEVIDSPTPIVSFQCGNRADMLALQRRLFDRGIHIYHSTYIGAGPDGIIRCSVFRDHLREDIDALIEALRVNL